MKARGHMKARLAVLVVFAAAVTLASVAAAGPVATKQRIAISSKLHPERTFVLTPLTAGVLKRDSGAASEADSGPGRVVQRDGQRVEIFNATLTFAGKRGTLTIRERTEWVDIGNDSNRDGSDDGVAVGTWKVVRGSGQYAGVTGGGRSGHAGLGSPWLARQEGLITTP